MSIDGTTTDGSEADVAEQHAELVRNEDVLADDSAITSGDVATGSVEADPADVADQHRSVPYDEEER